MTVPEPVVTGRVCSVCGLPWDDHGEKPTLERCIELLKAALAVARAQPIYGTGLVQGGWTNTGHQCGICGTWVFPGNLHTCAGSIT